MVKKILQKEAPVLREISQSIPIESITTPKIQGIIKEMKSTLASQDDGVAIAGPQIGYSLRIFVISKKIFEINKTDKKSHQEISFKDIIFINPVIKKLSREKSVLEEGCLSVRYLYGKVSRSKKAVIEAYDENGKKFSRGAVGLLAQIFQHEVDHLNGILFIDKAKYVEEIMPPHMTKPPSKNSKNQNG